MTFSVHVIHSGDSAEAETLDEALVAAATLVDDYADALPVVGRARAARRSIVILRDGMRDGVATALAQAGRRRSPASEWSA